MALIGLYDGKTLNIAAISISFHTIFVRGSVFGSYLIKYLFSILICQVASCGTTAPAFHKEAFLCRQEGLKGSGLKPI